MSKRQVYPFTFRHGDPYLPSYGASADSIHIVTQRRYRILRRQSHLRPEEPRETTGNDRAETGQLADLCERDADEDAGGAAGGTGAGGAIELKVTC